MCLIWMPLVDTYLFVLIALTLGFEVDVHISMSNSLEFFFVYASTHTQAQNIDHYQELLKIKQKEREDKAREAEELRRAAELQECSFTPRTTRLPGFIQEQAEALKSRRASLSSRGKPQRKQRPQWM